MCYYPRLHPLNFSIKYSLVDRLVTLKIANTNSDRTHPVTLQIAREILAADRLLLEPQVEVIGELPSTAPLLQAYQNWHQSYLNLDLNARLEAKTVQVTNISIADRLAQCQTATRQLLAAFERWLSAESFQPIRDRLSSSIDARDRIRIILQIDDPQLHRLPWQVANMFDRYPDTEVVVTSAQFESKLEANTIKSQVKILAILGNSQGINVTADRQILEQLARTQVDFLVEPQRKQLNDRLWEQQWDILFFAGHSTSSDDDRTGRIYINHTDSLSLEELRYGLKKAIANGLKIAIFNSCDGLGLAKALSDLQIPQVIVMREPVPDLVAQTFLTEFLRLYSQGNSFYRSVREAREKLQGLEDKFPCATWLPTIYQQGIVPPPTWQQLQGNPDRQTQRLKIALLSSLGTTISIAALRFLGIFQPLELAAFDLAVRSRPPELQDAHLVVVQITRDDVELQSQNNPAQINATSLADGSLDQLLKQLQKYPPKIIGIDIYLDRQIANKYQYLRDNLKSGNLISVCKVADPRSGERETQPASNAELFGFSDTIADADGTMRRHLLAMDAQPGACNAPYALSTMLASAYLQNRQQPIELKIQADRLQLGTKNYNFLTAHTGGYQQVDDRGYQILLNYRASSSISEAIPSISLQKILALPDRELKQLIANKIILIGTTDSRYKDIVKTSYAPQSDNRCPEYEGSQCIPGVFLQAQMTSQIVNAALENRPLFWGSPLWFDISIVMCLSTISALLGLRIRRWQLLLLTGCGTIVLLSVGSIWSIVNFGWWFPLIPSLLGVTIAGSCVKIYSSNVSSPQKIV
jgi:CHASE2 domain-containing sensor protein